MLPRKFFKTEKGTELPLLNLKGKEYLMVAHRLVWFREKYPDGLIKTEIIEHNKLEDGTPFVVFKAEIYIPINGQLQLMAVGHQMETPKNLPDSLANDYLAKCETSAIGRALAMAGIGTQFAADDLSEGDKISDAPLDPPVKTEINDEKQIIKETTNENKTENSSVEELKKLTNDDLDFKPKRKRQAKVIEEDDL